MPGFHVDPNEHPEYIGLILANTLMGIQQQYLKSRSPLDYTRGTQIEGLNHFTSQQFAQLHLLKKIWPMIETAANGTNASQELLDEFEGLYAHYLNFATTIEDHRAINLDNFKLVVQQIYPEFELQARNPIPTEQRLFKRLKAKDAARSLSSRLAFVGQKMNYGSELQNKMESYHKGDAKFCKVLTEYKERIMAFCDVKDGTILDLDLLDLPHFDEAFLEYKHEHETMKKHFEMLVATHKDPSNEHNDSVVQECKILYQELKKQYAEVETCYEESKRIVHAATDFQHFVEVSQTTAASYGQHVSEDYRNIMREKPDYKKAYNTFQKSLTALTEELTYTDTYGESITSIYSIHNTPYIKDQVLSLIQDLKRDKLHLTGMVNFKLQNRNAVAESGLPESCFAYTDFWDDLETLEDREKVETFLEKLYSAFPATNFLLNHLGQGFESFPDGIVRALTGLEGQHGAGIPFMDKPVDITFDAQGHPTIDIKLTYHGVFDFMTQELHYADTSGVYQVKKFDELTNAEQAHDFLVSIPNTTPLMTLSYNVTLDAPGMDKVYFKSLNTFDLTLSEGLQLSKSLPSTILSESNHTFLKAAQEGVTLRSICHELNIPFPVEQLDFEIELEKQLEAAVRPKTKATEDEQVRGSVREPKDETKKEGSPSFKALDDRDGLRQSVLALRKRGGLVFSTPKPSGSKEKDLKKPQAPPSTATKV